MFLRGHRIRESLKAFVSERSALRLICWFQPRVESSCPWQNNKRLAFTCNQWLLSPFVVVFFLFKHCLQSPLINFFPFLYRICFVYLLHCTLLYYFQPIFISKMHWQERALSRLCNLEQITWQHSICFIICKVDNNTYLPLSGGCYETHMR